MLKEKWQLLLCTVQSLFGTAAMALYLVPSGRLRKKAKTERVSPDGETGSAVPGEIVAGQEHILRSVVESIREGLIVSDENGRFLIWNRAAEEILGKGPKNMDPGNWSRYYGCFKADGVTPFPAEELPSSKAMRGEPCDETILFVRNEKVPQGKWLRANGRAVLDEAGSVRGGVVVFADVSEQKQALEALRASEERSRLLLESTAEGIYGIDLQGNCTFCNPAALRLLGYKGVASVLGKNMHELIHHSFSGGQPRSESECAIYSAILQGQGVKKDDEVFWRSDGSAIAVEYTSYPIIREERGVGAVVAFQDITQRKQAEEALRRSEVRFRAGFDGAAIGMLIIGPDGRLLEANQAFCGMTGYSEAELRQLTIASITHPDDVDASLSLLQQLVARETSNHLMEKRYVTKSGEIKWVKVSVASFPTGTGKPINAIGLVEDINERKQAESALKNNAQQLQALFDNALDAVVIVDAEAHFADVNAAACQLFGIPKEQLIGGCVRENSKAGFPFEAAWAQFLREGRYRGQHTVIRPDGKRRIVDISATANFLPGRHLAILRDNTEQDQLEAQLRQAQKMDAVGRLAGGIAHDFNNLLNIIGGFTELLQAELTGHNGCEKHLEQVMKATRRATSLTRQLLAFSRTQLLAPSVLDVNAIVADMARMLPRLIGEDIELSLSLASGLGRVKVDPSQLEQVILNLVVNARDAMPMGGQLTIETRNVSMDESYVNRHPAGQPGEYVMLAVTDTGTGMTEEVRSQIFEPFFTTKEVGKGTGLGLAMVYGIVKQSGGWIWVYTEVGVGTCFKIYLPLINSPGAILPAGTRSVPKVHGTETVLLVEDEEALREVAKQYLKGCGYHVLDARNGSDALQLAQQHLGPIHVLVTDVVMPKLGGRDLARQLCQQRPELRVIYVSGYTDDAIVRHGVLDTNLTFVQKPYGLSNLSKQIREVLDKDKKAGL